MNTYFFRFTFILLISNVFLHSMEKPSSVRIKERVIQAVQKGDLVQLQNIHRNNTSIDFGQITLQEMPLIHLAAATPNPDIMDYLITHVGLGHKTPFHGQTILHTAAEHGNLAVTKYLLEKNLFTKNTVDLRNKNPLDIAKLHHKWNIVSYLTGTIVNPTVKVAEFLQKEKANIILKCAICFEKKNQSNFIILPCEHEYCTDCLTGLVQNVIASKDTTSLQCPFPTCSTPLDNRVTDALISDTQLKDQLSTIQLREYLAKQKNYVACPGAKCASGFINERTDQFTFQCDGCAEIYCAKCLTTHSAHMTCQEAKENKNITTDAKQQEEETQKWKATHTRPCPECKTAIEKSEGCNQMKCKKCKHTFCWQCMKPWALRGHGPFGCSLAPAPAAAAVEMAHPQERLSSSNRHLFFIRDPLGFQDLLSNQLKHAQFLERFKRLSCEQQDEWGARITACIDRNPFLLLLDNPDRLWLDELEKIEGHTKSLPSASLSSESDDRDNTDSDNRRALVAHMRLAFFIGSLFAHLEDHGDM